MASILDQSFSVGKETTYGTVVSPSRAYEVDADSWKRQQESIPSVGMRPGLQGEGSDRQKTVVMGAQGKTKFSILNKGLGLLLQSLGTTTGPTQLGATAAWKTTVVSATGSPSIYYTAQMQRVDSSETVRPFTYPGSTITKWAWSHEVGGLLTAELDWDARTESTATAAGSAVLPSTATTYDWTQLQCTVNGAEFCLASFDLGIDLGLKTDRRLMCSTSAGLKRAPKRAAVPTVTGVLKGEFDDLTNFALYTGGTIVPIILTWTGATIGGGNSFQIVITLQACKFEGDTPEASLSDLTMQPLPFKVLYDQTNPMYKIEYTSTDTTL